MAALLPKHFIENANAIKQDLPYWPKETLLKLEEEQLQSLREKAKSDPIAMVNLANWLLLQAPQESEIGKKNAKDAIDLLIQASKINKEANYQLGICYDLGHGVACSMETAIQYYEKAGPEHLEAQCCLAVCQLEGKGMEKSITQAFQKLEILANKNCVRAIYLLGCCYEFGMIHSTTESNYKKACQYYRKAEVQGYIPATTRLKECSQKFDKTQQSETFENSVENKLEGEHVTVGVKLHELLKYIQIWSEINKNPRAMLLHAQKILGIDPVGHEFLFSSLNVGNTDDETEYDHALKILLSAGNKEADAFYIIGRCFEAGLPHNQNIAAEHILCWYDLACKKDSLLAMRRLGKFALDGYGGMKRSLEKGFNHLRSAMEKYQQLLAQKEDPNIKNEVGITVINTLWQQTKIQEAAHVAFDLALCYEQGLGCDQNFQYAMQYLLFSSKFHFLPAMKRVGAYYLMGLAGTEDKPAAFPLFKTISVEHPSDAENLYLLGYCYEQGFGTTKDLQAAIQCYEQAQDYPYALLALGKIYCGQKTNNSFQKAVSLFKIASQNGCIEADYELALCYEQEIYEEGADPESCKKSTLELFENAANLGFTPAIDALRRLNSKFQPVKDIEKGYEQYTRKRLIEGMKASLLSIGKKIEQLGEEQDEALLGSAYLWILKSLSVKSFNCQEGNYKSFYQAKFVREHSAALLGASHCLRKGFGIGIDVKSAKEYLQTLIQEPEFPENEDIINPYIVRGRNELALLYLTHPENSQNIDTIYKPAMDLLENASRKGHPRATAQLAIYYKEKAKKYELVKYNMELFTYRASAYRGEPNGLFELARLYEEGIHIKQDLKVASMLYLEAGEQGHGNAIIRLAEWYKDGIDHDDMVIKKDTAKSLVLYELGISIFYEKAKQGDADSQVKMGICQFNRGNLKRAAQWYEKAALQKNLLAQQKLIEVQKILAQKPQSEETSQEGIVNFSIGRKTGVEKLLNATSASLASSEKSIPFTPTGKTSITPSPKKENRNLRQKRIFTSNSMPNMRTKISLTLEPNIPKIQKKFPSPSKKSGSDTE